MKNYLIALLIGILGVGGFFVLKNKSKPTSNQNQTTNQTFVASPTTKQEQKINYQIFFGDNPNICEFFPKEKIEELLGKTFVTTKSGLNKTSKYTEFYCEYYQEAPEFKYEGNRPIIPKRLPISIVKGQVKGIRDSYKLSGYSAKQDNEISFPHQLIYDQNGKFRTFEIFLADDLDLLINPFQSNLSQEEALNFVKKFSLYFKNTTEKKSKSPSQETISFNQSSNQNVPLPQDEDIIKNFVTQIEDGKTDNAARMIKVKDESEMQAWGVQFSNITSFKLLKMEKANENEWTDTKHIYKVVLDVWMDPRSADAPISYYGWQNGENIRWLTLEKIDNVWKIAEIATGP